jgi:hypothetical protein
MLLSGSACDIRRVHAMFCVAAQGKFKKYLPALMTLEDGAGCVDLDLTELSEISREDFNRCQDELTFKNETNNNQTYAQSLNVTELPTLQFQGAFIEIGDYPAIKKRISAALKRTPVKSH